MSSENDNIFQMSTSNLRFGAGATREIGMDLADMNVGRVMLLTDPRMVDLPPVQTVRESLEAEEILYDMFDRVRVEPNDASFKEAIAFAMEHEYDGFVAVGGGSTIDTAKAVNLYSTYPDDFLAYVNAPIGQGKPAPGELKPLIAVPTTAGTGSETTGVAIFDMEELHSKTGIAHRRLRPTLGIVDPENTRTLDPMIVASPGLDVMCHAVESYTAIPYDRRPKPDRPIHRPAYQGSNPISDIWSRTAMRMVDKYLIRATRDPDDMEARGYMLLAASYAGMGFGNAGVHLCHGMSYPISSMVKTYFAPGYADDRAIIPHGLSVTLPAPAVFRFMSSACPERHMASAEYLGADVSGASMDDAGKILADRLTYFMQQLKMPNGLDAVGYSYSDIDGLVQGTMPQDRVNKLAPRPFTQEELAGMFEESMMLW